MIRKPIEILSLFLQKTDYSGLIRRILQDEGLAGAVAKLPLERKFKLDSVKEVPISIQYGMFRMSMRNL